MSSGLSAALENLTSLGMWQQRQNWAAHRRKWQGCFVCFFVSVWFCFFVFFLIRLRHRMKVFFCLRVPWHRFSSSLGALYFFLHGAPDLPHKRASLYNQINGEWTSSAHLICPVVLQQRVRRIKMILFFLFRTVLSNLKQTLWSKQFFFSRDS